MGDNVGTAALRVGLPPSPSLDVARTRAAPLVRALAAVPGISIEVAASYQQLGDGILSGAYLAAWAPPIVCARVEMAGGRVALRAVRGGQTSYRAGIVCRRNVDLDWTKTADLVAAWVDEDSAAGYLLARSWLAGKHVDAIHGFRRALFTGSYVTSLQAVADAAADVTSVFVSPEGAPVHSTLDEVDERLRSRLQIVATTGETQNDGVVLAPKARDAEVRPLLEALASLSKSVEGQTALRSFLKCDELRAVPGRPTSPALRELLSFQSRPR